MARGQLGVSEVAGVQIVDMVTFSVFIGKPSGIMKTRFIQGVIGYQIMDHGFRRQNVPGIAKIHDALGIVDTVSNHIPMLVDIQNRKHFTGIDSHAHQQFEFRSMSRIVSTHGLLQLDSAGHRNFGCAKEGNGHTVSGRK